MRLIDANALANRMQFLIRIHHRDVFDALDEIYNAPAIDPESLRPQGEWSVGYYNYEGVYVRDCSYCGYAHDGLSPYCPSCGAKMKGADNG